ncbi:MAG: hypothetical protein ACLGGX_12215 [Bdellovibrionia bacterium]
MKSTIVRVILGLMTTCSLANATPTETISTQLIRNSQLGQTLMVELSKNLYRSVPYEAEYTERVPYQEEEIYYIDVPYEEYVSYTDYEEYWESEYTCRNRTRYKEECRSERLCEPRPGQCREVEECGRNARGERICKVRKVCDSEKRECRDVRKCQQIPYVDQDCGFERVIKTRPVTKYRYETRYRKEARTRSVTKYRDVTRCCVTRYQDVFDRQWKQNILIVFPVSTQLLENEVETLSVSLKGTESQPDIDLNIKSDFFQYKIKSKQVRGADLIIELTYDFIYDASNSSVDSIRDLKLKIINGEGVISFKDLAQVPRARTVYNVRVLEQDFVVSEIEFMAGSKIENEFKVGLLDRLKKYTIVLGVKRQGSLLKDGKLEFETQVQYELKELTSRDLADLQQKDKVQLLSLKGLGEEATLELKDDTLVVDDVKTAYKVVVWKKNNGKLEWLGEKHLLRGSLKGEAIKEILLTEAGVSPRTLQNVFKPSAEIYIDVVVKRNSTKYFGTKQVEFIVSRSFTL